MQYWDLITSISLLFVVFVTPFEVAFVTETRVNLLFVVNHCVNTIFILDIASTFMLPVVRSDGVVIKSHSYIAKQYFKSWFILDFISVLPLTWSTLQAFLVRRKIPTSTHLHFALSESFALCALSSFCAFFAARASCSDGRIGWTSRILKRELFSGSASSQQFCIGLRAFGNWLQLCFYSRPPGHPRLRFLLPTAWFTTTHAPAACRASRKGTETKRWQPSAT